MRYIIKSRNRMAAPDFLYAALDKSACAAFFTESRMRLIDSNQLHRKSGYPDQTGQQIFPLTPAQV
jgi:hypothetical protein